MADRPFHTDITADASQAETTIQGFAGKFETAFKGMADQVKQLQGSMQTSFDSITAGFAKVQSVIMGVGAVIAGGGAFAQGVNKSSELTQEALKLARAFGITTTQGSVFAVALGDIFQSSDVALTANKAMTKALKDNEKGFTDLGISTRDSNGHFRNSLDLMLDVNERLAKFKEGTDRNIEGQKLYKKAWEEVAPLIKLTGDLMAQSKVKADALGLTIGKENVEAVQRYRTSMNDVKDVMNAVQKAVGDAVMPVLTELGNWFSDSGPQRVDIMRKAMAIIITAFYGLKMAVEIVWGFIKWWIENFVARLVVLTQELFLAAMKTSGFEEPTPEEK